MEEPTRVIDKLLMAKELLLQAESQLIVEVRSCPYELGFTLRKLEEAIEMVNTLQPE